MEHFPVAVDIFHKGNNAAFINKLCLLVGPFIDQCDFDAGVEKSQFPKAVGNYIKAEFRLFKNFIVRQKGDGGAASPAFADRMQRAVRNTPLIGLAIHNAFAPHFQFAGAGKRVDHRHADAVQTAGDFISFVVEFTSGVQFGHCDFRRRNSLGFVNIHRDAPAVVFHDDAVVHPDFNGNGITEPRRRLVNAVVDDFIHQVMKAFFAGGTDIHGRTLANRFQTF